MRRRAVLLVITMAVALAAATGVALAADIRCPNRPTGDCVGTRKADTMTGTSRDDHMDGRSGIDTMQARGGRDTLLGGDGDDEVSAGAGNDPSVEGEAGDDTLRGGYGNDTYVFDKGWNADSIPADGDGTGMGADTLDFSSLGESLDVDLDPTTAGRLYQVFSDAGHGMLNFPVEVEIENVKGGRDDDVIRGNPLTNQLEGRGGNDRLEGREGNDDLSGGGGADAFKGGPGNDALNGGDLTDLVGNDIYIFEDDWGEDTITDDAGTDRLVFGNNLASSVTINLAASDTGVEVSSVINTDDCDVEVSSGINTVDWPSTVVIENATGGTADDFLCGNDSKNTLNGQGGNDTIDVANGETDAVDTVDCGPGTDDTVTVDATSAPDGAVRIDTQEHCETVIEDLIGD
jgi:Ca2+-binding RTX toxin-like protein